ncbi:adenylosuccinate synthetase [candidate division TA06 bacterium SM1_40]|uniref:Adenylosuccinate synthetase n=2 Tax=Bacteria division TA06 TaxID=1156500 RepID=A0A0S8JPQ1_UNCT6|nr:MAG: adenylosuccinate synthetase [candidate division TA06 bacterium SM23_40]KPL10764.1 MAG: adenylosuccinate synthetase [candidate division TA06 bacterium SM1_40]
MKLIEGTVVLVGLQWGDEGKGKIVDLLARDADVVARFQGGANAGHTVLRGDHERVFHLMPTGILHEDTLCLIGGGVVVDPAVLVGEIRDLEAEGVGVRGRLIVSGSAHITLPHHKRLERLQEEERGEQRLGTTFRGIGPTYADKVARSGWRLVDLVDFDRFSAEWRRRSGSDTSADEEWLAEYRDYAGVLREYVGDTALAINRAIDDGKTVLCEGAQGTLLDVDFGTYPYVTSSNTIAGGACTGLGIGPTKIDRVLGVAKAYTTRVGEGPFPTEERSQIGESLRERAREYGATTGRPRRCGWFDAVLVRRAVLFNGVGSIALTRLDILDELEEVPVCTAYEYDGARLESPPETAGALAQCAPVYETLPGWRASTASARRFEDLPAAARRYVERIGDLCGVPVTIISVGPHREETLYRQG